VGVVPACPSWGRHELVREGAAWGDGWPRRVRHAVHCRWHVNAVPVHRGGLVQRILDRHANRVTFGYAQLGPRDLPVIGVRVHDFARRQLPLGSPDRELKLS